MQFRFLVAGQEPAIVLGSIDQLVHSVAVSLHDGRLHRAMLVDVLGHLLQYLAAPLSRHLDNVLDVLDGKGHHSHSVAVSHQVVAHPVVHGVQLRLKLEDDVVQSHHVCHHIARARLESLVGVGRESHVHRVPAGRLLGVAHHEADVIEGDEAARLGFRTLVRVSSHDDRFAVVVVARLTCSKCERRMSSSQ